MNEDQQVMERIQQIINEYAQLNQTNWFDLAVEPLPGGAIKILLTYGQNKIERVIDSKEDLSFIHNTFNQTDGVSDLRVNLIKEAHFDELGYLLVSNEDTTIRFKVSPKQREEWTEKIKTLVPKPVQEVKKAPVKQKELLYNYFFTVDGKTDSVIIAGSTIEGVEKTALDVLTKRGVDYQKNRVCRDKIN